MSGDHDDRNLDGVIDGYKVLGVNVTALGAAEPQVVPAGCEVTIYLVGGELPDWFEVGQRVRIGRRS